VPREVRRFQWLRCLSRPAPLTFPTVAGAICSSLRAAKILPERTPCLPAVIESAGLSCVATHFVVPAIACFSRNAAPLAFCGGMLVKLRRRPCPQS
jgi:hypothetical protein